MPPLSEQEIERIAQRRAGAKIGWYLHAMIYVLVNAAFFALSDYGFGHRPWRAFPLVGWGIGLALHGISVFILGRSSPLRQRMIERERERLRREQQDRVQRP